MYSFISGERGSIVIYLVGVLYLFVEKNHEKIQKIKPKTIFGLAIVFLGIIYISQVIRVSRGFSGRIVLDPQIVFYFFRPDVILSQDYAAPGYELMYCIEHNHIDPMGVLGSFLGNGIFVFDYPTCGTQLPLPGFANFMYIEGFMFFGWAGAVIYPAIVCLWFRFYYNIFLKSGDYTYKLFVGFLMVSYFTIHIVRSGETFMFLKYIYMYMIPASLLYQMTNGTRNARAFGSTKTRGLNYRSGQYE